MAFGSASSILSYLQGKITTPGHNSAAQAQIQRHSSIVLPDGTMVADDALNREIDTQGGGGLKSEALGLSGQASVVVGTQIMRFVTIHTDAYIRSAGLTDNTPIGAASAARFEADAKDFAEFTVKAYANTP